MRWPSEDFDAGNILASHVMTGPKTWTPCGKYKSSSVDFFTSSKLLLPFYLGT